MFFFFLVIPKVLLCLHADQHPLSPKGEYRQRMHWFENLEVMLTGCSSFSVAELSLSVSFMLNVVMHECVLGCWDNLHNVKVYVGI